MRQCNLALVLIRINIDNSDYFLLNKHPKWGDWSPIGGHVEAEEKPDDWILAATRESIEELAPWKAVNDFYVKSVPPHNRDLPPISWGPIRSKSANNELTLYHIRYYSLEFAKDPRTLLGLLSPNRFQLFSEEVLTEQPSLVSNTFTLVHTKLPKGYRSIPHAWWESIPYEQIPVQYIHKSSLK